MKNDGYTYQKRKMTLYFKSKSHSCNRSITDASNKTIGFTLFEDISYQYKEQEYLSKFINNSQFIFCETSDPTENKPPLMPIAPITPS